MAVSGIFSWYGRHLCGTELRSYGAVVPFKSRTFNGPLTDVIERPQIVSGIPMVYGFFL